MATFASIHPGEILQTEFLDELGITPGAPSKDTGQGIFEISKQVNTGTYKASFLPSSTPYWSKGLVPQMMPSVKTLCS
jgi:hypothetical protein